MGDFVLEKIGCYTVKIPHAFGAFCVLLVPFLSLHHAKTQSGGPTRMPSPCLLGLPAAKW